MAAALLLAYLLTLSSLTVFALHRLSLLALRGSNPAPSASTAPPEESPLVTIQLPLYNERFVAVRLLEAACAQDYPADRFEVQVLDDSTDDTSERVAAAADRLRPRGFRIMHLRRQERRGYKAGALAAGMSQARGEFVVLLDADFVPRPDFLKRCLGAFGDPSVGMVQARWDHLNRHHSLLTRLQAIFLDGHFLIEHAARWRSGLFFNFNGTAGIWRRSCLEEAGGWQDDTLTEDLDLSYRAQMAGWRFVYLEDVTAPAELPTEVEAFKSQQHRWAKGSIQTARKLLPRLGRTRLRLRQRLEAWLHLTNNTAYLLLLIAAVLLVPSLPARLEVGWLLVASVELPLFLLGTVSLSAFFLRAQRLAGVPGWRRWVDLPWAMALGIGLAVNNGRGVLQGLTGPVGEFRRTPKRGVVRGAGESKVGYRVAADPLALAEAALTLYFALALGWAVGRGIYSAVPFLVLYLGGFGMMTALQVTAAARRLRHRRRAAPRPVHLSS